MKRILTDWEVGEPILKALGFDLEKQPVIEVALQIGPSNTLPTMTVRHYIRDESGGYTLDEKGGLKEVLSHYELKLKEPPA